jgi:hypothetical protein
MPEELGCQYFKDVCLGATSGRTAREGRDLWYYRPCRSSTSMDAEGTQMAKTRQHLRALRRLTGRWSKDHGAVRGVSAPVPCAFGAISLKRPKPPLLRSASGAPAPQTNWLPSIRTYGLLSHGFRTLKGATVTMKGGFQKPCHGCSEDSRHAGSHDFLRYSRVSNLPHVRRKEEKVKTSETKK